MLLAIIRILYAFVCAGAIATFVSPGMANRPVLVQNHPFATFVVLMLATQAVTVVDLLFRRKRIELISAVYFGLLVGVLLSYLLIQALEPLMQNSPYRNAIIMLATLILPYMCISLLLQTKDDFRFLIPYVEFSRDLKGGRPLLLDSSALIDGRIADVVDTRILESQMVVPDFILREVQAIADSNDKKRRTRGRRGLDVLNKLKESPHTEVRIYEDTGRNGQDMTADQRVVTLAKELNASVVTNDFNLNKLAGVEGVPVINLNDVANALKPRFIPGDRLRIKIIKEGESPGQGVGYLDDGTMVVCEQASHLIGKDTDIIVTSVLQSSAGRMIFSKPVFSPQKEEKAEAKK